MKNWQKFLWQYWQMILTAVVVIILVTVVGALSGGDRLKGSSYSLEPQGYGAWYQKMVDKGVMIERWRKPVTRVFTKYPSGTTLLQVNSALQEFALGSPEKKWIAAGNTLVVLGVDALSNDIEFSQNLPSPQGEVKIETTRRFRVTDSSSSYFRLPAIPTSIVSDDHGAVVWQSLIGKGKLILATTPYLAANAYQDSPANYDLLTALTTSNQQRIVVDEYLHGYRNPRKPRQPSQPGQLSQPGQPGDLDFPDDPQQPDDEGEKEKDDLISYLTKTPFLVAFVNICLLLGVLVWQQNRRFGAVIIPQPPQVDNSVAYIQALGGILRQAQSSEFVLQNIGKAEQLKLQQLLGLGNKQLVDRQTLTDAWLAQTKLPAADLPVILQLAPSHQRFTEAELQQWLSKLQAMGDKLKRQLL
jgi:Domain of unknown function (DUF4350)